MLTRRCSDLAVLLNKHATDDPGTSYGQERKASGGAETDAITGLVELKPKIGAVDVANLGV